jgi:hypothetical protein
MDNYERTLGHFNGNMKIQDTYSTTTLARTLNAYQYTGIRKFAPTKKPSWHQLGGTVTRIFPTVVSLWECTV